MQTLKEVIWDFCEKLFHFCLQNGQSLKDNFHNDISRLTNETLCDTPPNESSLPDKARSIKIIRNKGGDTGKAAYSSTFLIIVQNHPKKEGLHHETHFLAKLCPMHVGALHLIVYLRNSTANSYERREEL